MKKELVQAIANTIVIIVAIILILFLLQPEAERMTYSSSGSLELLRGQGEVEINNTHLFYTSNDRVYHRTELQALKTLSKHYIIVLNPCNYE